MFDEQSLTRIHRSPDNHHKRAIRIAATAVKVHLVDVAFLHYSKGWRITWIVRYQCVLPTSHRRLKGLCQYHRCPDNPIGTVPYLIASSCPDLYASVLFGYSR